VSSGKSIKQVKANWTEVVLVCRKCSRKLDGGFGKKGEETLAKGLRKTLGAKGKGRKAALAVVEVDCLDVCPKDAVVAMRAGAPEAWAVVPKGMALPEVAQRLGLAVRNRRSDD
jgi:predicted metal-binding protein